MSIVEKLDLSNYVDSDILTIDYFNTFFKPISKENEGGYLLEPTGVDLRKVKETHWLKVWSMFNSADGVIYIIPGFKKDAIKYIITEEDWDTEENNIVIYN